MTCVPSNSNRQFLIGFYLNVLCDPACHKIEKLHGGTGKLVFYLHKPHPYLFRTYYTVNSPALPPFPNHGRQFSLSLEFP